MATLTRSGATGYSTANWKSFDVWGGERASTGSGSMFGYGGNLGHPTDPENGLIYMRARFYEPWTGRFLSEDPAKDGSNWYVYANNAPSSAVDPNGQSAVHGTYLGMMFGIMFAAANLFTSSEGITPHNIRSFVAQLIAFPLLGRAVGHAVAQAQKIRARGLKGFGAATRLIPSGLGMAAVYYAGFRCGEVLMWLAYINYLDSDPGTFTIQQVEFSDVFEGDGGRLNDLFR